MLKILFVGFALLTVLVNRVNCMEFNMTEYYKMPSLNDFDDYDRCLNEFMSLSTYCFVRADVIPKINSESWNAIVFFSKYTKHHFNHRHLYFGMCVNWCEEALSTLHAAGDDDGDNLFAGILENNPKVNVYLELFHREEKNRERYNSIINQCVNLRLRKKHELMAKTAIEYCVTNRDVIKDDAWNITFFSIVWLILLAVTLSSLYDLYTKTRRNTKLSQNEDHYRTPLESALDRFLVTCSLTRNWYRLTQAPNSQIGRDLRFLDCLKFFAMFLVIFAHTNWVLYEGGITNPQDPERLLHTAVGTILVSGSLITITFFIISGMLLTINFVAATSSTMKGKSYWLLFLKFNLFRYLRLTVPYAFVVLLSGVYFENVGGPVWRHINEREQLSCRKNWWTNLLYVNNFINLHERCILQGWYLASDFQAFILSLLILMLVSRWPRIKNIIFALVILVSALIPAVVTYVKKFEPIFIPSPQTQRDSFIGDTNFDEFYTPFYMNFGCYFFGVLAALTYNEIIAKNFNLRSNLLFQILWWSLFLIGILWMFTGHPFFQFYFEKPLAWGSVYAAVQRNGWAFGLSVIIIGFACKVGWIFRRFACLPIFRILGRLTYGAFIMHLFVIRQAVSTTRGTIFFGPAIMFTFITFNLCCSYLCSLILALFIELPISSILKFAR